MSLARRMARRQAKESGVHLLHMARPGDPIVWHCSKCDTVTVRRVGEEPRCGSCNAELCDGCKAKLLAEAS